MPAAMVKQRCTLLQGQSRRTVTVYARRDTISPIRRSGPQAQQQPQSNGNGASTSGTGNTEILSAFFYGRALAATLNKRLSEIAVDAISEISKAIAERPTRLKDFQAEVEALARKEMGAKTSMLPAGSSSRSSSTGSSGGSGASGPVDAQAAVDELRAEIAYARASLQQIKIAPPVDASNN